MASTSPTRRANDFRITDFWIPEYSPGGPQFDEKHGLTLPQYTSAKSGKNPSTLLWPQTEEDETKTYNMLQRLWLAPFGEQPVIRAYSNREDALKFLRRLRENGVEDTRLRLVTVGKDSNYQFKHRCALTIVRKLGLIIPHDRQVHLQRLWIFYPTIPREFIASEEEMAKATPKSPWGRLQTDIRAYVTPSPPKRTRCEAASDREDPDSPTRRQRPSPYSNARRDVGSQTMPPPPPAPPQFRTTAGATLAALLSDPLPTPAATLPTRPAPAPMRQPQFTATPATLPEPSTAETLPRESSPSEYTNLFSQFNEADFEQLEQVDIIETDCTLDTSLILDAEARARL